MGCTCNGNAAAMYEHQGIVGFLPTEGEMLPTPQNLMTALAVVGGIAIVAYLGVRSGTRKKRRSHARGW